MSTAAPKRKPRPNGQWALGETEPLNENEKFKAADNGLNVRERIEQVFSKEGFDSIPAEDLRGRMRWWGLYTQRRPGIPGGKTASLPIEELDDSYFMMRVRSDGGALSSEQARVIADISVEFARDTADISDRQNIQLHWIRIEDVPEIWRRLEAVGLGTTEACGDTPRVILGSPVAGVAADEIIDGTWATEQILARYIGDPEYANLPRKFKSAISGSPKQDIVHEINDISFVGVNHPKHGPGWDLWVGGGLSTVPKLAVRLGVWVANEDVADVWQGVISIFRDYGYRRLRNKARLKFLVADWGAEKFRQVLEDEYLGHKLPDGPPPPAPPASGRDHVGVHEQKDGNFYVGAAPTVGRISGTILRQIADLAADFGDGRIRLTPHQKFVILGVPGERTEGLVDALELLGLEVRPSQFRKGTMACTGIEYCKLAIVETKGRAKDLVAELEQKRPGYDLPLTINVNGCPNSCARFQVADIGLKGMLATNADGEQTEGFQVHVGGSLGTPDADGEFGRTVKGMKLPAAELGAYTDRLIGRYTEQKKSGETFAQWAHRAPDEALR
ncbi:MAG: nitrite/sulfite reductase [Actinomycetia bacterium]|nr:nitrite/sulfite reductase [Actinomycetes bacterium]